MRKQVNSKFIKQNKLINEKNYKQENTKMIEDLNERK